MIKTIPKKKKCKKAQWLSEEALQLAVIDRVPEKLWTEICDTVQEAVMKTIPKKKKCKKAKWMSEEALQIAMKGEK